MDSNTTITGLGAYWLVSINGRGLMTFTSLEAAQEFCHGT
jgi:hypothetical protein